MHCWIWGGQMDSMQLMWESWDWPIGFSRSVGTSLSGWSKISETWSLLEKNGSLRRKRQDCCQSVTVKSKEQPDFNNLQLVRLQALRTRPLSSYPPQKENPGFSEAVVLEMQWRNSTQSKFVLSVENIFLYCRIQGSKCRRFVWKHSTCTLRAHGPRAADPDPVGSPIFDRSRSCIRHW